MKERYKIDAQSELVTLEARIVSTRKSLDTTNKRTTADVAAAVLPSLERRAAALRAEIETLPERPALNWSGRQGNFPINFRTTPLTQAEQDAFPKLPECLVRTA